MVTFLLPISHSNVLHKITTPLALSSSLLIFHFPKSCIKKQTPGKHKNKLYTHYFIYNFALLILKWCYSPKLFLYKVLTHKLKLSTKSWREQSIFWPPAASSPPLLSFKYLIVTLFDLKNVPIFCSLSEIICERGRTNQHHKKNSSKMCAHLQIF